MNLRNTLLVPALAALRIENGLVKEHWDEAVIAAPAAR
jgi:hypothetical protein